MALELSELKFVVDDSDLKRASDTIGNLVTNVGKLDKAARDAAQTEVVFAKAAKLNADANLQNAKAQDVRLKSTITADKADQQAAAAIERKTKATEKATESSAKNVGVLQRQKDILEFQTQGFSRGQSSILSYAKAAGLAAEDIGELGKVLETQRKLMGGDPFDKSLSGLKSLRNQYTELKESIRQYATDSNLTAKQTRELARDKERLIEKMKVEGASFSEIRKAVRAANAEYVKLAEKYNKAVSTEAEVIKSRKEAVNATNYLTQADQKMAAALNTSNAALDKAGTDSLVKYESALRKSGVSQDVATQKLATYKAQLAQVAAAEEKRRAQHLTRALTPQISDVVVSLWSGQSPLTVLLQQGSQINDMFQLSGVAAADFGKTVKEAFSSMIPSILTVVKGVGGLLVDGLTSAGNAVLGFVGKVTGMSGAIDGANKKLMDMGWTTAAAGVRGLGILMTTVFAAGAGAVVAGLVAIGVALKQAISENDKMAVALGLTGAAMGLTFATATDLSKSMQGIGVSTSDAMKVLTEMAKQGKLTSEDVRLVTKAAVDMNTYAGVAIEDTVKQFVKMKEKPVEAMLELAKATGLVAPEVVKAVIELEDQGKTAEATSKAIEELARVNDEQVARMKESYNGFSLFMIDLGKGISKFFSDAFKDLFYAASPTEQLKTQLKAVDETLNNWGTMNMDAVGAIQMLIPGEKERLQLQRTQLLNQIALLDQEKQQYEVIQKEKQDKIAMLGLEKSVSDELAKRNLKRSKKKDNLQDFTANFIEEKAKDAAKSKNLDLETIKNNDALMESYKQLAQVEWESAQKKPKKDPQVNYLATLMREATNATITADGAVQELTKSQIKLQEVQADPRYQALASEDKKRVAAIYEKAVATEKATAAQDLANKLLGKADMLGSTYYETIKKIDAYQQQGTYSAEYAERLRKAAFDQTELAKTRLKIEEDSYNLVEKYRDENEKALNSTVLENAKLDDRLALLGLTSEQQKYLRIEQERRNKLLAIDLKLQTQIQEVWDKWGSGGFGQDGATKAKAVIVELEKAAAEERKNINREVAVQYREDFQREFIDPIRDGLTDSLVTALFEGGKSGSKKLRDLVVAQLRKPVTMVVNAVVNTVLGNIVGNLMGGAAGGAAGGVAGSALSSIGSLGTLWNAGSSALSTIGSFLGFGGAAATGLGLTASAGAGLGLASAGGGLGLSLGGTGLGISAGSAGAGAIGGSLGSSLGAGAASSGGAMSMLGAAMPWIAGAAGLYSIISSFDDSGTLHTGGAASYSAATGQRNSLGFRDNEEGLPSYNPNDNIDNQFGTGFGWTVPGKETISAMETLSKSLVEIFDGIAKTFGKTAGYEVSTAFADDTSEDGAWGALKIALNGQDVLNWNDFRQSKWAPKEFGDGEEGYKQYLAAVAKDSQKILMDSLSGVTWAKDILAAIGDSPSIEQLSTAVQEIATLQAVFEALKRNVEGFGNLSDEVLGKLVKSFGGAGNLTNAVNQFYTDFYTEAEKTANVMSYLTSEFNKQNLVLPKTREDYRKLVESQDLNTESGRELYTVLLQLSPTFASVVSATEELTDGLDSLTSELLNRSVELQIEKLRLLGQEEQALAMERGIATKGMTDQQVALWDANKAAEDYNLTLKNNADLIKSINTSMPSLMKKFLSEDEWATYQTGEVAKNLVKSGIAFNDITQAIAYLNSATKDEIGKSAGYLFNMAGLSLEQKQVLMESAGIMADLKDTSSKVAEDIKKAFTKAGDDIVAYIKELTVGRAGLATPMELLDKTRQVYTQDLAAANAGDSDAAGRLVQSAKDYIDAQKTVTASSSFTNDVIKTIIGQLSGLGFVKEQLMASNAPFIPQFANGGTFDSGVVSKPTLFNIGQMGEAGPEAIMPLSRTSGGRLGVTTDNSSTNRLIAQLIVEVKALREQQSQETAGIISTNISVTEGTAQAVVDKLNEKDRQASSQPALN